jgi:hypothetical protein
MLMRTAQQSENAGSQLAAWHGVKSRVDGLVREAHWFIHSPQCERNLFWTQAAPQLPDDFQEKLAAHDQLARHARLGRE